MSTHTPLQSVVPEPHWATQWLWEQVWPLWQTVPQAPQLAGSWVVSTQSPPHGVLPLAQVDRQALALQTSASAQAWPQLPQLAWSAPVSTQVPPQLVSWPVQMT